MDIKGLKLHLSKKNTDSSLFIVSGTDHFLKGEAESLIKSHYSAQSPNLNIESHKAPQMDYEKCLDSVQTLSFFSELKIIHIKDAEKAPTSFLDSLKDFFSKNTDGIKVILTFSKLDKRKKSLKALIEKSVLVEVKTPYDNQVEGWIKYISDKEKLKIKSEAVSFLNFLVGPSLVELSKSIQKLKDVFGDDEVTKEDVKDFISKTGEEDIFKICDFLGFGEVTKASLSLQYAIKHGASSIGALSLFHRHFKIIEGILKAQTESKNLRRPLSQKDLAQKVGVPPYFLSNYLNQARNGSWTLKKTSEVFLALEAADQSLKSSRLNEETVFAGFFMEFSRVLGERKGLRTLSASLRL